jgi:hypothetical protein
MKGYPKGYKIGDTVKKEMGISQTGVISNLFHWKQSTDGTYKAPEKGYVPVSWDDGTCGYCHVSYLIVTNRLL